MSARFGWSASSPRLPPSGIVLGAPEHLAMPAAKHFVVSGAFRIPEGDAAGFSGSVFGAVALLVQTPFARALRLIEDELVFPDDEARAEGTIAGYFELDLFERCPDLMTASRVLVNASLFAHLSPVVVTLLSR